MFSPEFEALNREAGIAAAAISQGVASLNKAHYAHKPYYHSAFFSFSIGLERMAKLIFVLDHLEEKGTYPSDKDLRTFGHGLVGLIEKAKEVRSRRKFNTEPIPSDTISRGIIEVLSDFAIATRYYNLDYLVGGRSAGSKEPLQDWYGKVADPIVTKHYRPSKRAKDEAQAEALGAVMDRYSIVLHTAEDGSLINSWAAGATRSAQIPTIQRYSRMYVLRIVRTLYLVLSELSYLTRSKADIPSFGDYFGIYRNDDTYFLRRKTWDPFNP